MRAEFRDIDDAILDVQEIRLDPPPPLRWRKPIQRTQNQFKPRDFEIIEFERGPVDAERNLVVYRRVR